eukprot:733314_1
MSSTEPLRPSAHVHGNNCGHTQIRHDDHHGHIVDGQLLCAVSERSEAISHVIDISLPTDAAVDRSNPANTSDAVNTTDAANTSDAVEVSHSHRRASAARNRSVRSATAIELSKSPPAQSERSRSMRVKSSQRDLTRHSNGDRRGDQLTGTHR